MPATCERKLQQFVQIRSKMRALALTIPLYTTIQASSRHGNLGRGSFALSGKRRTYLDSALSHHVQGLLHCMISATCVRVLGLIVYAIGRPSAACPIAGIPTTRCAIYLQDLPRRFSLWKACVYVTRASHKNLAD